jgi:hypothetical protein
MLNEFDQCLEQRYLNKKSRKDRWYNNMSLKRPIAAREGRTWQPALSYCRYADDFVIIVKGTRAQAESIRDECRQILESDLKLQLNMEKTALTHVNDGFTFLGHRLIRKRGPLGNLRAVTQIPHVKFQAFTAKIVKELSSNYEVDKLVMLERLNRKIRGWANFYQFTDFTAVMFCKMDRIIFWKFGYWLARKYRVGIRELIKKWVRYPKGRSGKTWYVYGFGRAGKATAAILHRMLGNGKKQFRWKTGRGNPYLCKVDPVKIFESHYSDVTMAMSQS